MFAQVGINTTTPEAALDIASTNSGILIPRVALTGTDDVTTVTNPQTDSSPETATLVYNTNTQNDVTPGFYYWGGSQWESLGASSSSSDSGGLEVEDNKAVQVNVNQPGYVSINTSEYALMAQNQNITISYATGAFPDGSTTNGDPYSVLTEKIGNSGMYIMEAPYNFVANFWRMDWELNFTQTHNDSEFFRIRIVSVGSGAIVYETNIIVPMASAGATMPFTMTFPTIADSSSIGNGYRIVFNKDNNQLNGVGIKLKSVVRVIN